ncbi:hypothetical protein FRX31_025632 [Thalictrum thalictroides]|uniref:Protein kinase domain-containing protein n=1 Tax=Thalictrum thalictroides TaxID=46969 RepID=A0A7J6VJ60_THATH|nr:hypothetical protein FRX31_025632 [Thalictrum thalictroides]
MSDQYTLKGDVYSFGVVMLDLLTSHKPFERIWLTSMSTGHKPYERHTTYTLVDHAYISFLCEAHYLFSHFGLDLADINV